MSFDLIVNFTGLCMFVPEDDALMHVLLPTIPESMDHGEGEGMTGPAMGPHRARVIYDMAYTDPRSVEVIGEWDRKELAHRMLDFSWLGGRVRDGSGNLGDVYNPNLPKELLDFNYITGQSIDRTLVADKTPGERLLARVTFGSGAVECYEPGALWEIEDDPPTARKMAWWIKWRIADIRGDRLDLALEGLNGGQGAATQALHPIDGEIELFVYHVPPEQLPPNAYIPPEPSPGTPPGHIHAFFELYDHPASTRRITFSGAGKPSGCAPTSSARSDMPMSRSMHDGMDMEDIERRGESYTCALARGSLE